MGGIWSGRVNWREMESDPVTMAISPPDIIVVLLVAMVTVDGVKLACDALAAWGVTGGETTQSSEIVI